MPLLKSLSSDQNNYLRDHFAQSVTGKPFSSMPLYMWIKVTMNKGSKVKAGCLAIMKIEKQLTVNTKNANNIGRVRACLQQHIQGTEHQVKHIECAPIRRRVNEKVVQNLIACMEEFNSYPFDPSMPTFALSSSASTHMWSFAKT